MSNIYVVVEGQTEQTFVRDVLSHYIGEKNIHLHPCLIGKPGHKGGNVSFKRALNDIHSFLKQRNDTYITTMFDYFGIDSNWPGKEKIREQMEQGKAVTAAEKAQIIEEETYKIICEKFAEYNAEKRFIPYVEMHEFEALLFSDPNVLSSKIGISLPKIDSILEEHGNNPEEINDTPDKSPSKRLKNLKTGYRKVAMGKIISEAIGIQKIRKQCYNFDSWVTKLEKLKK